MEILYDFQEKFADTQPGEFTSGNAISVAKMPSSVGTVVDVEDVKTLWLNKREDKRSGILIHLKEIAGLNAGDRITVTGRIGEGNPIGSNWGIALISPLGVDTQQIAPNPPIFSLTHMLEESELHGDMVVYTVGWGIANPLMDFFIDGVLITRRDRQSLIEADIRTKIYSLEDDSGIQWLSSDDSSANPLLGTMYLIRAGEPSLRIYKRRNSNTIYVGTRVNDYDGIDINLSRMGLRPGNKYNITVTGKVEGIPPEGSVMMLQGLPGYVGRVSEPVSEDSPFTLEYTLSQMEVEKWTGLRVCTNYIAETLPFYIYSLDIVRL